jgi:hypothetical protein
VKSRFLTAEAVRNDICLSLRWWVEGSQEWDIPYRKYYNDQVKKPGV